MPGTAVRWARYLRRQGSPLASPQGASSRGLPFLTNVLGANARWVVEIAWGADLNGNPALWNWTDVTADVYIDTPQPVAITVGRADEATQAQPATCSFRLDNTANRYSANNPACPNYPYVRRNTPVRVSINTGTDTFVRFQGNADGFPPDWAITGSDARVTVSASGVLRRVGQGTSPLRSPLTRATLGAASAGLRQFWPCEDPTGSTQLASAISGQPPLAGSSSVVYASVNPTQIENLPYGTAPIADFKNGANPGATFVAGSASSWTVQIGAACYDFSGVVTTIAEWTTPGGTFVRWQVVKDTTGGTFGTRLIGYSAAGTPTTICSSAFVSSAFGECTVTAAQSGGNINVTMYVALDTVSASPAGTLAGVSGFTINPTSQATTASFGVGQVRIWDGITAPRFQTTSFAPGAPNSAWWSFVNENAIDRLGRLCNEQGITLSLVGDSDVTMGPQAVDTFLTLLRECETADGGVLFDGFGSGLSYSTRTSLYSQPAATSLDISNGDVFQPFQPVDDDQRTRNLIRVDRKNGSSATSADTTGPLGTNIIGTYDSSVTVNYAADAPLPDRAAWEVHRGTVPGFRYPSLTFDLSGALPGLASAWLATRLLNRVDALNASTVLPQLPTETISVLLEGYTESIGSFTWNVAANCSPNTPWRVAEVAADLGDTNEFLFRPAPDVGAMTVAGEYGAGFSGFITLNLLSAAPGNVFDGLLADDLPVDLDIAGWRVTMTNYNLSSGTPGAGGTQQIFVSALPGPLHVGNPVDLWNQPVIGL